MKKTRILWVLAAFQLFSRASAQVTDFAPVGAKWYYSEQAFFPPPYGEFPHVVEVVGKQMYQGKLCSKLIGIGTAFPLVPSETVPDPLYVYSQNDSVFFYSLLSGRFELLYDFGAETGDTWVIGGMGTPGGYDSLLVHVDTTSQLLVNGHALKVLHIAFPLLPYEWGFEIVAGVGNTYFLTPDFGLYEGGPMGLRCYIDPNNELHFGPYLCDTTLITVSAPNIETSDNISVSPNPAKDLIHVQIATDVRNCFFRLFHQTGQLVHQTNVRVGMNMIETTGLNPGLYVWELFHEDKPVKHGRIAIGLK